MKNITRLGAFASLCLTALVSAFTMTVSAAPPPPADLRVQMQGPASAAVYSPYVYTVTVKNIGNQRADNVKVVIDLPLTDTSPTRTFLGTLSGYDPSKCSIVSLKLQCNLQSINHNQQKVFTFNFSLPISTKTLQIKATGSTTSNEPNQSNNIVTLTPNLAHPTLQITSANVLNSHCTGRGLTSYFECELFPSSIAYHTAIFESDNTITLTEPGWTGQWDQPTLQQLHFTYTDGMGSGMTFNGWARSATCFEGVSTFIPDDGYVAPYRVCIQ